MPTIDEQIRKLKIGIEKESDPLTADWVEKVRRRFETLNKEISDATPLKTGGLRQSARVEVPKVSPEMVTFQLKISSFYKFTDSGVAGTESGSSKDGYKFTDKKPPVDDLVEWANMTGWNKWALQTTIFKHGIKGTGWYSNVVDDARLDQLRRDIARDIKDSLLGK